MGLATAERDGGGGGGGGMSAVALGFGRNLVAGGAAGIVAKTAFAPIDRVKLLLQTQASNPELELRYRGTLDCIRRVYVEQGLLSFWRGNMANVVRYFPQQAINFASKDVYKKVFLRGVAKENTWGQFWGNLAAGGAAGGTCLLATYPLDLARTRLAADVGRAAADREFNGLADCILKIFRGGGLGDLYQGFPVAFTGIVVFRALYMGGYDFVRARWLSDDASLFSKFCVAQVVTTVSGTMVYPIDTIRRRLMMQSGRARAGQPVEYSGALEATRVILRKEGAASFYSGLPANILRSGGGALMLVLYEAFKDMG